MVFTSAFYLANIIARGGKEWEQEKAREEFDDIWMSTIGSSPQDPRYVRIISDMDKIANYLLETLFYTPQPNIGIPEYLFQQYFPETGLLIFEQLEGFA